MPLSDRQLKKVAKDLRKDKSPSAEVVQELLKELGDKRGVDVNDDEPGQAEHVQFFTTVARALSLRSAGRGSAEADTGAVEMIRRALTKLDEG